MLLNTGAMTPLYWFLEILAVAAFVCEVWGFVDALRRPSKAFLAAGKQNKPLWLIILGVASAIYLTDVRPKVREYRGSNGSSQGPYGPW